MGPNGSGKTTLAYALMGHPAYIVKGGEVLWKGRDILKLSADKRARLGMFLAFQYPTAIPGLSVASLHPLARSTPSSRASTRTPTSTRPTRSRAASRCATSATRCARRWRCSGWTRASRPATSTRASRAARRSASRCSRWPSSSPRWRSSTRPTPGSTSTPCASSPRASTRCSTRTSASCSSPTTSACSTTSRPTQVHVLAEGRIVKSGGKDLALRLEDEGYGPILREAGLTTDLPDEALLVPKAPAGAELEAVESAR